MSVTIHSCNLTDPLNGYSYLFDTSHNSHVYPLVSFLPERFNTVHQFSGFTPFPDHSMYSQLGSYKTNQDSHQLSEIWMDNSKNFLQDKMSIVSSKPSSSSKNSSNKESTENKSKIWRPFSPPPASQESNVEESNIIQNKNTRSCNRSTFFSIKPSNVKIGLSKTSVFKAVKKNTFACSQCSSRYLSNRQLNSHMRVHTGSKPFHCEYPNCFKSFARNEELTRHKRIHSGFKPHMCTICKKRFGRKDHLSKHLKTHLQTSEKKVYQCPFTGCGHRYTRSDALTRHKSTAHAIKCQR